MEENIQNNFEEEKSSNEEKKVPKIYLLLILVIFVSSVFGAIFGFMAGNLPFLKQLTKKQSAVIENINKEKLQATNEDNLVTDIVEKTTPAVVSIVITKDVPKYKSFFDDPFGSNFFFSPFGSQQQENQGTEKQKVGGGSGFIITSDGMIVTNKHVVEDTEAEYTVITNEGKEYPAKILARDPSRDVALIKIEGNNFPVLPLGDSDSVKIGQTVIAIGNSLGEFSNTVSKGIISGSKRNVTAGSGYGESEQLSNIFQTDAAVNPGNSGGPLIDLDGKVIGINVAMAQGAENIAFSIPVNHVKKTIDQVKNNGKISTPFLGIRYVIVDETIQKKNNLEFNYGALVIRGQNIGDLAVIPGSPADKAGIVENDIILEIEGNKVDSDSPISSLISDYNVGDTLDLKVWHKGETKDVKVKLEERK